MSENAAATLPEPVSEAQIKPKNETNSVNWTATLAIAGAVASVLGLPAAFWIANRQQPTKHLRYEVISSGPLANVTDNVNGRLKVTFDKTTVPDANFAVLRVSNDGNQPILADDFKTPFTFHFGKNQKSAVLDAAVTAVTPGDATAALAKKDNMVSLVPGLFNPGDTITVKVLYAGGDQNVGATGRVVGTTISRQDSLPPDTLQIVVAQAKNSWFAVLMLIQVFVYSFLLGKASVKNSRLKSELKVISGERGQLLDLVSLFTDAAKKLSEETDKAKKVMNDYKADQETGLPSSQVTTPSVRETSYARTDNNGAYAPPSEEQVVRLGAGGS